GIWWFDGLPHTLVTVANLRTIPEIGLFGAEREIGDHIYAVFDRMPENTVMVMTITIRAQDEVRNHLAQIQRAAVGDSPEAKLAGQDAEDAQMQMAKGNKLFPVQTAFYVRGASLDDLYQRVNTLNALLLSNQIQPIRETDDLLSLDSYIRNLPMNYQHEHDRRVSRRSRLMFSKHAANMIPLYGRSVGTGHPGVVMFNRGAEPLTFDPLNKQDRKKNAHMLLIGPTGSGKSATLVYLILQMIALYRPRVFIIEVGGSFELLGKYLAHHGVSVNQVTLTPKTDISLPPFSEALKLLDEIEAKQRDELGKDAVRILEEDLDHGDETNEREDDSKRDLLGEMEISARIMITGGDQREDDRLTRPDRLLIRQAILLAAQTVKKAGRDQVLTEDVVHALRHLPELTETRKERAGDMADAMALFCDGLGGHFFNRPGQRWPNRDVTIVDMGILAREGYEDQLTVAYIGLMNHIHDLVERHQNDERPTLVITDEGHIITTNPLLSPYVIKIVKMWRKLGAWFWIATQSLEDFPDASKKMLGMLEWWICLVMEKDDLEHIARFKKLSEEQHALLLAARKSPGLYTEGVVFSDDLAALFRNVPPALALALGMTEKDEKATRHQLMREHNCTELEAVMKMAEAIASQRRSQT
ncbi:MAG TPA: conjugative transfer ATPase, partial [Crenotrichaceae bacterium]|nr:conjugative transfer ATPase [Crenotrichaceae bacterium]